MFTDKGNKLTTAKSDLQTVKDMLEVAKHKGWDSIKIKGSKEFKSLMFVMAESQGIRTSGYSPKPEDLAMVERLRQEYALNGIETAPRQERRSGVSDGLKQEQEQERRPSEQPGRSGDTPTKCWRKAGCPAMPSSTHRTKPTPIWARPCRPSDRAKSEAKPPQRPRK